MPKLFRITTVPISVEKLLGNQLTYMSDFFDLTAISSDDTELSRIGAELGIKTYAIEMSRKITPFQDLKSLWLMYRYFKKEKPDIVHTHTPKAGLIGMVAAKIAGVKLRLHTVAGLPLMETSGVKRILLNNIEKLTYACANKVYPNSFGLRDFILNEKLCPSKKLLVLGNGSTNGIDTDYFNPDLFSYEKNQTLRMELGIDEKNFLFVFVGRLVKDKGINELVSAFKKISYEVQDFSTLRIKLLLVGAQEDDLDPLLPETLAEIKSNPDIISVGFQKDVRPYLAISDVLTFPSYREGFPNVVLQAGAMGLPAIVSDINGCNEIIIEGKNGVVIPIKDETSLSTAMRLVVKNQDFCESITENARPMILNRYQQLLIWESLRKEYSIS